VGNGGSKKFDLGVATFAFPKISKIVRENGTRECSKKIHGRCGLAFFVLAQKRF
jgi:hypothetical protein